MVVLLSLRLPLTVAVLSVVVVVLSLVLPITALIVTCLKYERKSGQQRSDTIPMIKKNLDDKPTNTKDRMVFV